MGYKSIHLHSLFFIIMGLLFLFTGLAKEFFNLLEEGVAEKKLLQKNVMAVISICLAIVFLIGFDPVIVEQFM